MTHLRATVFSAIAVLVGLTFVASPAFAAKKKHASGTNDAALSPAQVETNYTQAIEKRTADVLSALELKDAAKAQRVHDALIAHYRALRALDASKGDSHAAPQTSGQPASLQSVHEQFVTKLAADLTPEQVDQVKDKLTYNKVKVTYDAYCQIVPNLTETHKAKILALLCEAREQAIDGGSSDEKSAIFKKYKGKINTYLSAEGFDVGKAYKDWGARLKEKNAAKGQPAAEAAK